MTANPYADAYTAYWQAGWRGVLPLPYRAKKEPPTGYTGRAYAEPSYADCATWAGGGPSNICLHLPRGVVGIDVDDYGDKGGGATLQALVQECGPLPATWLSTSRGDGISGIRLFAVPDDAEFLTILPGIEIIQAHHRYVVAWPSIHPDTGGVYEWVNEATGESGIPTLADLPALPQRWLERLVRTGDVGAKADVSAEQITEFMAQLPDGQPCQHVIAAAGYAMQDGSRHDTYLHAVIGVLDRGRSGCPGALPIYRRLHRTFMAEVTRPGDGQRTTSGAEAEWGRSVVGAIALSIAAHPEQGHGCPDDYLAELMLAEVQPEPEAETEPEQPDERVLAYQKQVAKKAAEMQLLDDARQMLAVRRAGQAPPLDAVDLSAFLAQPDEATAYRVDKLWPDNGRVLLAAAAKAGKTTMVTNLLGCLADGGAFLGLYDVQPVTGTVVYLNLEVGPNQMRRWLRRAGIIHTEKVHVVNLRGVVSALTLASATGRERVAGWLRGMGAEVVVLDPLAPLLAACGLDENSNTDVATFFSWWSQTLHTAGVVDDLVAHHAGHAGGRSRGASRLMDEPDALWTITRDHATDEDEDDVYGGTEPRFFKAVGRDVEVTEQPLEFDGVTGLLTLGSGNRKQMRAQAKDKAARTRVLAAVDAGNTTQRTIRMAAGGNEKDNVRALDSLVEEGVLRRQIVGQSHLFSRVVPKPVPTAPPPAPVTGAHLYKGTGNTGRFCEDCGTALEHAGTVICKPCSDKRLAGGGL